MPKPIMQDMIVKKAKPLRNNSDVTFSPKKEEIRPEVKISQSKPIERTPPIRFNNTRSQTRSYKWLKILFIFVALLVLVYFTCNLFENTRINIKVKHQVVNLNKEQFTASKSANGDVNFEITISNDQELKMVSFGDSSVVSEKAKGSIMLYNAYTTTPQKILVNTFVEDTSGKAYKMDKTVSIPAYKIVGGKVIPGQVIVSVTAFLDGESYNGTSSDFIITAFKNTPKAKKLYGKLNTPISGGAKGLVYKLTSNDRAQLDSYANTILKDKMLAKMSALVPKGYILYPNASTFSYHIDDNLMSKEASANVIINTTVSSLILKEQDLMKSIIKNTMPDIVMPELSEVQIASIKNLTFNFINKSQVISKDMQSVAFTLTGDIDAVWNPDLLSLKQSLAGINKDSIKQVLQKEPGIASSDIRLFPAWKSNLPSNQEKIYIKAE